MDIELHPLEYRKLLESSSAIPWRLEWPSLRFSYMGPQVKVMLGWAPNVWVSIDDWTSRIHIKDRDRVLKQCLEQASAGKDYEVDYRAITSKGNYLWVRDVVHIVRGEQGKVESLAGFRFNIHQRKMAEQELERANERLLQISLQDRLTGIGNRRMFDEMLDREWRRAMRLQSTLSLLIVNIDHFHRYNDMFGYLQGDVCIKSFATIVSRHAKRACDVAARLQDEEFALLYPDTDINDAQSLAASLQVSIADNLIPFPTEVSQQLTASIGIASIAPTDDIDKQRLFRVAINKLSEAKRRGRNQYSA